MKKYEDPEWNELNDPEVVDWKRVRSAIEHENELTNHRLTWLLTSQAFLFAAYVLTFQVSAKNDVIPEMRPFYRYVLAAIAITGILVCGYLSLGVLAAQKQHEKLEDWWAKRNIDDAKRHPPLCGAAPLFFLGLPYYLFPFVFWVAWIIFLIVSLSEYVVPHASKIGFITLIIAAAIALLGIGYWAGHRRAIRD